MSTSSAVLAKRRPAENTQRTVAWLMIAISLGYLVLFVPRGWVAHDEGMIGQSAERVLLGDLPHVDFQELYTGGLTWLYAAVFKVSGVDLIHLRWLLFAGAALAQLLLFAILRRFLNPIGAALVAWVGLAWSFPNFFVGQASWWILICTLWCLWAFIRHVETGLLRHAALAGLAAGLAITVKQTGGVFLLVALIMSLLYEGGLRNGVISSLSGPGGAAVRIAVAVASFLLAFAVLSSRLALAEMLYLLLPIAACSRLLLTADGRNQSASNPPDLRVVGVAVASAAVPFACLITPYIVHHQLGNLFYGLVILPQKRLQVFANIDLPSAGFILAGIPLVALVLPFAHTVPPAAFRGRWVALAGFIAALALLVTSLYSAVSYQIIWQSSRAFAALLPIAICWHLVSGHVRNPGERRILFGLSSMLAWSSLVQFPFSAPIYFCYVAPVAIIAGTAAASSCSRLRHPAIGAWIAVLLMFAVLSMNRGYIYNLGQSHAPQAFDADLQLPRAHLRVSANDALTYRRLVALVGTHLGNGRLVAGPDCPEVYFLTGRFNPSGALFDFFADDVSEGQGITTAPDWMGASVIVLNHRSGFSPGGPPTHLTSEIRSVFPEGETVGWFEVRWR